MRHFVVIFVMALCTISPVAAQTYLQHLQKHVPGQGSVTVTQSKEIDELVNEANVNTPTAAAHKKAASTKNDAVNTKTVKKNAEVKARATAPNHHRAEVRRTENNDSTKKEKRREEASPRAESHQSRPKTETEPEQAEEEPIVDMRKKMPRRSYKVNGYRVQVFAGGNSRNDKIRAQRAGNNVKMAMPELPVYVHFYSPRWICRVGNFRSYEEAHAVLRQVRKLGYKQACIVSGKITVAY